MSAKEARARIKINKLLEAAGWRFFDTNQGKANIALEPNVKLTQAQVDAMGNDFEAATAGFIDFLLLDEKGFPLLVLEAKAEDKNPLIGKVPDPKSQVEQITIALIYKFMDDMDAEAEELGGARSFFAGVGGDVWRAQANRPHGRA